MKLGLGSFGAGTLVWVLFTSLAFAVFFSRRIRRELKAQGKPLDLRSLKGLFSDSEYSRSDIYGALLSWTGCAVTIVALVSPTVQKVFLR